ncbi:fungal zn(2)-Cys(6) binuclear cluster domain-containing protein [Pochonia chlamydosporia 170]|uniref:Fungal zn(2)-Cys(6) binuclear cluster domain-containing protein n=1 Tax=Pochonia chlamydosporia 170 TaxID=1380566 RepID=A0A179EZ05_METCM|nr:fungal zn(2)-Cys(6) binuclear cluster domain-containing protein [Pochonia chlamydosporia 170]OAQ58392.2 fungal zn(2)-Cys(6) binuclear cluster domain-containing protein [Pochonia chlamydosporia 170]
MEKCYRALLPRNMLRPVTEANARSGNETEPESKLVSACDKERPSCTRCDKQGMECVYITNAGETRSSAFKRKYNSLEEELDTLRTLFSYVQTRPQSEAQNTLMSVIQLCQDPAEAIQLFLTQGDGATEIEEFAEAEVSESFITPTCSEAHPFLAKHLVHVQARPWTTVAGDAIVSQIISQFFIDERPLALPIVDFTVFIRDMTQGDGPFFLSRLHLILQDG